MSAARQGMASAAHMPLGCLRSRDGLVAACGAVTPAAATVTAAGFFLARSPGSLILGRVAAAAAPGAGFSGSRSSSWQAGGSPVLLVLLLSAAIPAAWVAAGSGVGACSPCCPAALLSGRLGSGAGAAGRSAGSLKGLRTGTTVRGALKLPAAPPAAAAPPAVLVGGWNCRAGGVRRCSECASSVAAAGCGQGSPPPPAPCACSYWSTAGAAPQARQAAAMRSGPLGRPGIDETK